MRVSRNQTKKEVCKPIHPNFAPKRLAICYDPPMIIIEYLAVNTGKLYHHKIRLGAILQKHDVTQQEVIQYIKNKHNLYFVNNKIKDVQLIKLVNQLMDQFRRSEDDGKENIPVNTKKESKSSIDGGLNYSESQSAQNYLKDIEKTKLSENKNLKTFQQSKQNFFLKDEHQTNDEKDSQEEVEWNLELDDNFDFI